MSSLLTLQDLENFLVHEASLLDSWLLDDWINLMADDANYLIPSLDYPNLDPNSSLYLINDDMQNLRSRVSQLKGKTLWAENPRSRTRRFLSNFMILSEQDNYANVTANFLIWQTQLGKSNFYVGRYEHLLTRNDSGGLIFKVRKAILDLESLCPHGKISFIL